MSRSNRTLLLAVLLPFLLSACNGEREIRVQVDNINAWVETALTYEQRSEGLMGRESLERDHGMLFVFPEPQILKFWMLNTPLALDVGFFDAGGKLLNVAQMEPDGGKRIYRSAGPALYALEMNRGWFRRHGLRPGVRLHLPEPIGAR